MKEEAKKRVCQCVKKYLARFFEVLIFMTEPSSSQLLSPRLDVYVEPEVSDPFLIDSDESDEEVEHPKQDIPVSSPTRIQNLNKDVPPPPSDSEVEDAPEIYQPGLVLPTMFLPIPNVGYFLS